MVSPGRSDSKGDKSSNTDETKATATAAAPGRGDGDKAPAARAVMTWLPKQEVTQILSRDPRSIEPFTVEALRGVVKEFRPNAPEAPLRALAEVQNEQTRKKYVLFQKWVRGELYAKGFVEVPDEFIRDRDEARKEQVLGLMGHVDLCLPDKYFIEVGDDDGEEELVFSFMGKEMESGEDEDDDEEESDEDEDEESDEDDDE